MDVGIIIRWGFGIVVGIGFIGWIIYLFYWVLKQFGLFKKKPKQEIYQEIINKIDEGKSFNDILPTNINKKQQEQYINAYLDIKEAEKEIEGGKK